MTINILKSRQQNINHIILDKNNPKTQVLIDKLKSQYHVRQMPFVQVISNNHVIASWTGFHPDKIKQYSKETD